MVFSKSVLPLGEGIVCHSRAANGAVEFVSVLPGGNVIKRIEPDSRNVKTSDTVSFADGCVFCGDGLLEMKENSLCYIKGE